MQYWNTGFNYWSIGKDNLTSYGQRSIKILSDYIAGRNTRHSYKIYTLNRRRHFRSLIT